MNILIGYRVDQRINVVEISSGSKKFLVGLEDFSFETGIRDFSESNKGSVGVTQEQYKTLWGDRIQ